ncbi:MAG: type I secretion system permease/ATPase [Alsobacter sp.]
MAPAWRSLAALSFFINLLAFAPSLYMMNGFDRVLGSRNIVTWAFLTLVFVVMIVAYGALSNLRTRILVRAGVAFDQALSGAVFAAVHRAMLAREAGRGLVTPVQALRDLDTVRENLSGRLVASAVDLAFAPLFLAVACLIHPLIGLANLVVMIAVATCGFLVNLSSAGATLRATAASVHASEFAATMLRNSEAVHALGMLHRLQSRWKRVRDAGLGWTALGSDSGHWAGTALTCLSFGGPSLVMGVTLLLILENTVTSSALFGAMLIASKSISPMNTLASNWKSFVAADYSFQRIDRLFGSLAALPERMPLPRPRGHVGFESVSAVAPGTNRLVLREVSFELEAGQVLGVIGPSAAGKSSLARVLVGVWPTCEGAVRIDGNEITHWESDALGQHIGYIPQDVELFRGTVAENIARFGPADSDEVIAAATLAGVHELIQSLPDGYNTEVGEGGANLSGGQRQRIALARAVLGRPPLVVLDEPNASLDTKGEESLAEAIRQLRSAGSTVVIITHRSNMISQVDRILLMSDGGVHLYGSREDVMKRLGTPNVVAMSPGAGQARPASSPALAAEQRRMGA